MQVRNYLLAGFFHLAVFGLPWDGPQPTPAIEIDNLELVKREAHEIRGVVRHGPIDVRGLDAGYEQWKRAAITTTPTFSSAAATSSPNATCGFFSGEAKFSQWCPPSYTCAIATKQSVWGCCSQGFVGCELQTSCVPQTKLASCADNDACRGNNYITLCDESVPYCNTQIVFGVGNDPATNLYCDSTPNIFTLSATATDNVTATASFDFIQLTLPTFSSTNAAASSTTSVSSSISSSNSASTTPTTTPTPTSTNPITNFSSPPPSPTPSSSGSSVPIGAIVGGVVGGVAVIAAVIFGIFWFCFRNKKRNENNNTGNLPPPNGGTLSPPVGAVDAGAKGGAHESVAYYPQPGAAHAEKELFTPNTNSPQSPQSQFTSQYGSNQPGNTQSYVAYSPPISPAPGYSTSTQHQPVLYPQGSELDGTGVPR